MPYKLKLTEIFLDYFCLTLTSNPVTGKPASECAARPLTELRVSTPVGFGVLNTSTKLYELWPQLTSTAPLYALSGGAEWFVDPATGASYIRMPLTGTTPAQLAAGVKFCVTCAATVSTTGCVNALTNGCRFSTAYINHFALNNPQGCIKCTTNAYGWCGTGSTATYCCAV
ncbi:hypothetical protein HYH03_005086 [Edaphochlamys debaryana]|uniref:Uncharacterized protein n=1 Tax=Edaphochlamys debaryana TaxID=47281 RepID=A0A835Y8R8_9CHLO|nr:hypothetical protein HYH03_005086 [Edaphochlamys debaryana]|eukprot:KAG2497092.1 hypothetical protein HYH03_005086 [Edaphochlamys debaryana]